VIVIALCDVHGYGRVALPNRVMIGHCMIYLQRLPDAVAIIEEARNMALRAGNPHAEMFAAQSLGVVLTQSGQVDEAMKHMPAALDQARALGARRYESNLLCHRAECPLHQRRRSDGLQAAQDAVAIARELGLGFDGPYALAVLARATDAAAPRAALLAEGEAVLRKGSVGHNRVWYYRYRTGELGARRPLCRADPPGHVRRAPAARGIRCGARQGLGRGRPRRAWVSPAGRD
jgi:hypothetical protein